MEIMDISEDDAKDYKAAIYRETKMAHPELGAIDRALAMEKLATKEHLSKINIENVRREIKAHLEKRKAEKAKEKKTTKKTSKKASKKETKKTEKKTAKKTSKKTVKKTAKKTSKKASKKKEASIVFSDTSDF